jgi:hypothetical protein
MLAAKKLGRSFIPSKDEGMLRPEKLRRFIY